MSSSSILRQAISRIGFICRLVMRTPSNFGSIGEEELRVEFGKLRSRLDVAKLLCVSDRGLRHLLYGIPKDSLYYSFSIPKKRGGARQITAPNIRLKTLQRRLARVFTTVFRPRDSAHGFIRGRGIKTNAQLHTRRRHILNVDLKDFFPAINFGRVRGMLMANPYGCVPEVATTFAQICCHNNQLPQGAPTSPVVSNMICARLDSLLINLTRQYRCRYSRYADDITISSNSPIFPATIAEKTDQAGKFTYVIGRSLQRIVENNGFRINEKKTRLQRPNERQMVTGLVTNKRVNTSRAFIREIRAMLHNWESKGIRVCQYDFERKYSLGNGSGKRKKLFKETVKGKIDFVGAIRGKDDSIYLKFLQKLSDLDSNMISDSIRLVLKEAHKRDDFLLDKLWVIDASNKNESQMMQGTAFCLANFGIITCAHIFENDVGEVDRKDDGWVAQIYRRSGAEKQVAAIQKISKEFDLAALKIKEAQEESLVFTEGDANQGDQIYLAGFPQYGKGNTGVVEPGYIIGKRNDVYGNRRILISASILSGNSGGPVLNENMEVIGVAARGNSSNFQNADEKNFYEVIPIQHVLKI